LFSPKPRQTQCSASYQTPHVDDI